MRLFNIRIIRQKVGVPPIDNAGIIAQPARDFIQANTGTDKQAGESASHGMRRNPRKIAGAYMLVEGPRKVVSVPVSAMLDFRLEHIRFTQSITFEERTERVGQGYGAFLSVLEIHGGGFA